MEITSKFKEIETHHSPLNSPSSHGSSTTSNGPIPITRSDPNSPYPTTFVTADTSSFKQVVQMLTGSPKPKPEPKQPDSYHHEQQQHQPQQHSFVIPPVKTTSTKPGFKLYERRNSSLKHMMISPLISNSNNNNNNNNNQSSSSFSPRNHSNYHHFNHINGGNNNNNNNNNNYYPLSPSLLDFPSLTLSPVTPLVIDTFDKSSSSPSPSIASRISSSSSSVEEEDKAIAEKGFYLHPSPRDSNPKLLPLFPVSSPRVSDP